MKVIIRPLLCLVALPILSCRGSTESTSSEIIFLTDHYQRFVDATGASDGGDVAELYGRWIKEPICTEHFQTSEYGFLVRTQFEPPIIDVTALERSLRRVEASRESIASAIAAAIARLDKDFDPGDLTFYILPPHPQNAPLIVAMKGVIGMTAGSTQILLTVEPDVPGWQKMLEYAVAHEFSHAYWTRTRFNETAPWTLLDYLVFEGKADHLAQHYYPDVVAPWTQALTAKQTSELWTRIQPELASQDFDRQVAVMFGAHGFPTWGGYTLGFDIVQTALRDSDLSPEERTMLDAQRILEMSAYTTR